MMILQVSAEVQSMETMLSVSVQCMKCSARSNTYDPFMDLSLDIRVGASLINGFEFFFFHVIICILLYMF